MVTDRAPYVAEADRMVVEPLDKGCCEMSLHFGFAEAPAVPAALEAMLPANSLLREAEPLSCHHSLSNDAMAGEPGEGAIEEAGRATCAPCGW